MPPRYAYWTIIVDDQATAFRAGSLEDIMPTFNRLKEKNPTAKLLWFQNGKLWPNRVDAREAMQMRGERGRDRDPRQVRPSRDDHRTSPGKPPWDKPAWKPTGEGLGRPEWKPKTSGAPRASSLDRKSEGVGRPEWKPKTGGAPRASSPDRSDRQSSLEWKPKGSAGEAPSGREAPEGKRKWIPKAEYKRLTGTEAPRDEKWRPGGEHKDPRQKYKDAKKAKWGRVKQTIRARAQKPRGKTDK